MSLWHSAYLNKHRDNFTFLPLTVENWPDMQGVSNVLKIGIFFSDVKGALHTTN
jgi:hypothetical protein